MSDLVLISHFYNEEYLLPWWLKHHKNIFDHAIMIDYASTDSSVKIISEMCPSWEIVKSRNEFFEAASVDKEVMDLEESSEGIKICLNTTEFLMSDRKSLLDQMSGENKCLAVRRICMVDEEPECDVSYDEDLTQRKDVGVDLLTHTLPTAPPWRFIHNHNNGCYGLGRHNTSHPINGTLKEPIFFYKYSPWNERMISRKTSIKGKIPESDAKRGFGRQHMMSADQMNSEKMALSSANITRKWNKENF